MIGLGLSLVAAVAILAACLTKSSDRALAFITLALLAILGATT